jgi:hypothetical protein
MMNATTVWDGKDGPGHNKLDLAGHILARSRFTQPTTPCVAMHSHIEEVVE